MPDFLRCHPFPVTAFLMLALFGGGARMAIGGIYTGIEAIQLLESLARAGLYLASAIATGSATIMALMLTLIGMMRRMDQSFDDQAYRNIELIARLATINLLIALVLLLAFVFPVGEFEQLPARWFDTLYDVLFATCVMNICLAGAMVVLIYTTTRLVIAKITPGDEV